MEFFEKSISNLIENQFPDFYKDEGPIFIEFVKAYYEWMEDKDNPIYHSRRLMEYGDIDSTVDDYLIYFKNKYLNNIQFDTAVSTQNLVKHSLDLYRSKGTERAIDLFFRSIFGATAEVYYPARDLFKASSGDWVEPIYLEVSPSDNISKFEGLQIEGINSGATAFVEKYVRKKSKFSSYTYEIYYISDLRGDFQTGEKIRSSVSKEIGPTIIGSLNAIEIINGSSDYKIGDIVNVYSNNIGRDALARVDKLEPITGKVSFELTSGGWGYNENSKVLISENVLSITNVNTTGTFNNFKQFETVIQPIANVYYNSLIGDNFNIGDTVYRFDPVANDYNSSAIILNIDPISNDEGYLRVGTYLNKFNTIATLSTENDYDLALENGILLGFEDIEVPTDGSLYKLDNSNNVISTANIIFVHDESATANVIKYSSNVNIMVSNTAIAFNTGDEVYQVDGYNIEVGSAIVNDITYIGDIGYISLKNVKGAFNSNNEILSRYTGAIAHIDNITLNIGVVDIENDFVNSNGNRIIGSDTGTYGTITSISQGFGANFTISNTMLFEENITLNTDIIGGYFDVLLDAPDYGFPAPGAEDIHTLLGDAFSYSTQGYGKISSITITNNGNEYNHIPYVIIYEPNLVKYNKRDWIVYIENANKEFLIGELVQQNGVNKGLVKEGSNNDVLLLERISFSEINTDDPLIGMLSNAECDVSFIEDDLTSDPIGMNATIEANTTIAEGSISLLTIIDSGFGYYDNEVVSFKDDLHDGFGTGRAAIERQGKSKGFHKRNNSLTNSNKYLQDSYYYQEFSYEIRSPLILDTYANILKNIIHMSGTKYFSRFVFSTSLDTEIKHRETKVEIY